MVSAQSAWKVRFFRGLLFGCLIAGIVSHSAEATDTFDVNVAKTGLTTSQADCKWPDSSVWIVVNGKGDCLRYFHSGLKGAGQSAHIFLHGDVNFRNYRASERRLKQRISREQRNVLGIPHIWVSRPGVFGSSGNHRRDRRTRRELDLILKALDAIKRRHRIGQIHLSGQSSGGRLVSLVLAHRNDIGCAVMSSAGLAQRKMFEFKGFKWRERWLDPMDFVQQITDAKTRRVFVVGDPFDKVVPFDVQQIFHDELARAGKKSVLISARGKARGPKSHQLAFLGLQIVRWCVSGVSDDEIVSRVRKF